MTQLMTMGVLAGTGLGAGLWLVLARLPFMRRTRFVDRIAPQLKSVDVQSRLLTAGPVNVTPFGPLERIIRPVLLDAVSWLGRFNLGMTVLSKRLAQAGRRQTAVDFRAEQLLWAVLGLAVGILLALVSAAGGGLDPITGIVLTIGLAAGGFLLRDYMLTVQIQRRETKMLAEFPSLAELMALAVSAGESTTGALERICRSAHGELADEFATVLADTRSGTPLLAALQDFSRRSRLQALVRFVDGITVAVERGTPLADVLRAQAQDVRDMAKRSLMESAGKKEIAMMVPLVFGVLPLTVLFAVYPGLALINLGW
ncbi:type II secretion system F family protein [Arthrobacter crystallopoietes]|uniref:type II secretion system F family protein n=1 Tax=Crystallibacter crystallopoietes TaxID=37928 RepID=UPI001ABDF91B|nr:type II secretion system F family protein [Arthrobacter crystallopoietes]QTG80616.1 type II secretion system F family protein [Arthrobacter crystallopoietes]